MKVCDPKKKKKSAEQETSLEVSYRDVQLSGEGRMRRLKWSEKKAPHGRLT